MSCLDKDDTETIPRAVYNGTEEAVTDETTTKTTDTVTTSDYETRIDCAQNNPNICDGLEEGEEVVSCNCNTCRCQIDPTSSNTLKPACIEMGCPD